MRNRTKRSLLTIYKAKRKKKKNCTTRTRGTYVDYTNVKRGQNVMGKKPFVPRLPQSTSSVLM